MSKPLVPIALLPPGIRDDRQKALVRVLGDALAEIDIASLVMSDPMTVDVKLLPFMIREFSAHDFIQADYPEHVQRRILKNIWNLKSLAGYDAGVKLGLKMLGMTGVIEHWHQLEPKGLVNTQTITFYIGEQIFKGEQTVLNDRVQIAARHMIKITKRQSQETEMRIGARFTGEITAANAMAGAQLQRKDIKADRGGNMHSDFVVANSLAGCELHRKQMTADRNTQMQSGMQISNAFGFSQLGRFTGEASP